MFQQGPTLDCRNRTFRAVCTDVPSLPPIWRNAVADMGRPLVTPKYKSIKVYVCTGALLVSSPLVVRA